MGSRNVGEVAAAEETPGLSVSHMEHLGSDTGFKNVQVGQDHSGAMLARGARGALLAE
jgi:hypothetical protein